MKGDKKLLTILNSLLADELTATNQYGKACDPDHFQLYSLDHQSLELNI